MKLTPAFMVELVREPGKMEDRGTVDDLVVSVREVMGREKGKCAVICERIRVWTRCGINARNLPWSLAAVSEVEAVERENMLVRDISVRAGGLGQGGGVHDILLHGTKELGDNDSGQVCSSQLRP